MQSYRRCHILSPWHSSQHWGACSLGAGVVPRPRFVTSEKRGHSSICQVMQRVKRRWQFLTRIAFPGYAHPSPTTTALRSLTLSPKTSGSFWREILMFSPPISAPPPVTPEFGGKSSPIHPGAQARDLEACVTTLSFAHPPRPIHQQILLALIPKHIPILRF